VTTEPLAGVVGRATAFLFDFDGPICAVFAGVPAIEVAVDLRRFIRRHARIHIPSEVEQTQDPLELIRWAGDALPSAVCKEVDAYLQQAEVAAVATARPTPHAEECIRAMHESRVPLAVVSNNSAMAVEQYLVQRGLRHVFSVVVGRVIGEPALMKPDPALIEVALVDLGMSGQGAPLFIGDSVTDCQAARAAGVPIIIAYANRPSKVSVLQAERPDALITHMSELEAAFAGLALDR